MNLPEGWKLVPVEPTEEMIFVVATVLRDYHINRSVKQTEAAARLVIAAALGAAPRPNSGEE